MEETQRAKAIEKLLQMKKEMGWEVDKYKGRLKEIHDDLGRFPQMGEDEFEVWCIYEQAMDERIDRVNAIENIIEELKEKWGL